MRTWIWLIKIRFSIDVFVNNKGDAELMEFIIGFIMGSILAQIICYLIYKNSLDEIQLKYTHRINKVMEMLDEYNRQ